MQRQLASDRAKDDRQVLHVHLVEAAVAEVEAEKLARPAEGEPGPKADRRRAEQQQAGAQRPLPRGEQGDQRGHGEGKGESLDLGGRRAGKKKAGEQQPAPAPGIRPRQQSHRAGLVEEQDRVADAGDEEDNAEEAGHRHGEGRNGFRLSFQAVRRQNPRKGDRERRQEDRERVHRGTPGEAPGGESGESEEVRNERRIIRVQVLEPRRAQKHGVDRARSGEGLGLRSPETEKVGRRGRGGERGEERRGDGRGGQCGSQENGRPRSSFRCERAFGLTTQRQAQQRGHDEGGGEQPPDAPRDRNERGERHEERDHDGADPGRQRDPAERSVACVGRVESERRPGHGQESQSQEPQLARSQDGRLRQTVPSVRFRRTSPGGAGGAWPTTTTNSANRARSGRGMPRNAAGNTRRPGRSATAR